MADIKVTRTISKPDTSKSGQTDTKWPGSTFYPPHPVEGLLIVDQDQPTPSQGNSYDR